MSIHKIDLIRQALSAAESSLRLARQLLAEVEGEIGKGKQKSKELPGIVGIFDGQNMVTEKGEKFPVPENYASKSILVAGDTLKLVDSDGDKRFKQIEHVKRHKTTGILTKKDGKWAVVTPEGSYRVLPASVEHFDGAVGDEALLQLPANNLQTTWAAVENITKKEGKEEKRQAKEKKESQEQAKSIQKEKKEVAKEIKKVEDKVSAEEKPPAVEVSKVGEAQKEVKESEGAKETPKPEPVGEDELR